MTHSLNRLRITSALALLLSQCCIPALSRPANADQPGPGFVDTEEQSLLESHVTAFETLFDAEWSPDHWSYGLEGPVDGAGTYFGANHLGQEFTLSIVHWIPVMSTESGQSDGAGFAGIVGWVETDLASVPFIGTVAWTAASIDGSTDGSIWAFLPTIPIAADSVLLSDLHIDPNFGTIDENDGLSSSKDGGPDDDDPIIIEPEDDCIDAAHAAFDEAVANCDTARDASFRACNRAYNTAMIACNATYNAAIDKALTDLKVCTAAVIAIKLSCIAPCLALTGGWGFFFCLQPCLIAAAVSNAVCQSAHDGAVQQAKASHNICTGSALTARNACRDIAEANRDACIANAQLVRDAQIANCTATH